jgi:hypothetical protein
LFSKFAECETHIFDGPQLFATQKAVLGCGMANLLISAATFAAGAVVVVLIVWFLLRGIERRQRIPKHRPPPRW